MINPYLELTKGQVCQRAIDAGLPAEVLVHTVSCAHPPIKRKHDDPYHCGYCYPCLVRRAALHHALDRDGTEYLVNPWQLPSGDAKADDLRALMSWLATPFSMRDLLADLPLPNQVARVRWCPSCSRKGTNSQPCSRR
ncbi:MAG: 7-cyano-7-deazaguanine synthase [Mycobacteriales bacterium]